jgi:hypothetical protein
LSEVLFEEGSEDFRVDAECFFIEWIVVVRHVVRVGRSLAMVRRELCAMC